MSDDIIGRVKSFVLGMAFPLILGCFALSYVISGGHRTRAGHIFTPAHSRAYGLWQLGVALCVHGIFYLPYDHHPRIKFGVIGFGVILFFAGLYLQFN